VPKNTLERKRKGGDGTHAARHQNHEHGSAKKAPAELRPMTPRRGRLCRRDDEGRCESYADILGRAGLAQIEGRGMSAADPADQLSYAMHAHGAVFAEVKVDPDFGQIRATRVVGAFAAGRIINPRMVESQLNGGMIWGVRRVKNGTPSTRPIQGDGLRALRRLQRESPSSPLLFVSERGSSFPTAGFARMIERATAGAGLELPRRYRRLRCAQFGPRGLGCHRALHNGCRDFKPRIVAPNEPIAAGALEELPLSYAISLQKELRKHA
jgi:hypothetical protein